MRHLLLDALVLIAMSRLGLWLFPVRIVQRTLVSFGPLICRSSPGSISVDQLTRAIVVAGRRVPGATCLPRAVALQVLLLRAGRPAHLRIGFARSAGGQIHGHAWIESDGQSLLRESDAGHVAPVLDTRHFVVQESRMPKRWWRRYL